jgi:hypothetical protein
MPRLRYGICPASAAAGRAILPTPQCPFNGLRTEYLTGQRLPLACFPQRARGFKCRVWGTPLTPITSLYQRAARLLILTGRGILKAAHVEAQHRSYQQLTRAHVPRYVNHSLVGSLM